MIDTRISPKSKNTAWNKESLAETLGIRYVHVKELGNRLLNQGKIAILNMEQGVQQVAPYLRSGKSIVLMCACTSHHTCHRSIVAAELARRTGCKIVNWTADDLKHAADAPSRAAALDLPLQMSMFPEV